MQFIATACNCHISLVKVWVDSLIWVKKSSVSLHITEVQRGCRGCPWSPWSPGIWVGSPGAASHWISVTFLAFQGDPASKNQWFILVYLICPGSKIQALRIKDFKCFFTVLLFGQRSDPCHSQVEASANASSVELLRQCRVYDHEFSRPESVICHLGRGQICRIFLIHVHRPSEQCSKPCVSTGFP